MINKKCEKNTLISLITQKLKRKMNRPDQKIKSFLKPWKVPEWVPEDFPNIPKNKVKVQSSNFNP